MMMKNYFTPFILIAASANLTGCVVGENIASDPSITTISDAGTLHLFTPTPTATPAVILHSTVTTIAGVTPFGDGSATTARYPNPFGIAGDTQGNFYVTDAVASVIRKIAADGSVTTVAGSPFVSGTVDGTGASANFYFPYAIALDPSTGSFYISDQYTIRRMTSGGTVTTVAGSGGSGFANGTGSAASFGSIGGLAVDNSGNVYITDETNNLIRMMTPAGVVTTYAGTGATGAQDGTGASSTFQALSGIAVDSAQNLYVVDYGNCTIRKITPDVSHTVSTVVGTAGTCAQSADGNASSVTLDNPGAIEMGIDGNLYFVDYGIILRSYSPTLSTVVTIAGGPGFGFQNGATPLFSTIHSITQDTSGTWYVVDGSVNVIREINATTHAATTFSGLISGSYSPTGNDGPADLASFGGDSGVISDAAGNVYVADSQHHTIRKLTPEGIVSTYAGTPGACGHTDGPALTASFCFYEAGLAFDSAQNLYVTDATLVRRISPSGIVSTYAGTGSTGITTNGPAASATFGNLAGIAIDPSGNIFVADDTNNLIRKIDSAGNVTTFAGASSFVFNSPKGLAVDIFGYVYVADYLNHAIEEITPDGGLVSVLAGSIGQSGNVDGNGTSANFHWPTSVAVDVNGNVYVTDAGNHSIRKITFNGNVTTLTGTSHTLGLGNSPIDGSFTTASFSNPWSISLGTDGKLYLVDGGFIRLLQL
jgi:sugar lactone lactonase YvrE